MSWEAVENAMQTAVSLASGLPTTRIYWGYQKINEALSDHVVIHFGGEIALGIDRVKTTYDSFKPNGQEIKTEIKGVREVPFDINCFTSAVIGSAAARRIAELIRTRIRLPSIRYGLQVAPAYLGFTQEPQCVG